ncbi:Bor family protein [Aliiglaciecola sp. LCG003]|uniref:Bor family protein n=1 Tax=Aliiglaciecola sp. LCG003 TaxID=3053655 RepID=UPI002574023C|nr:Bor family protein [Aliiglaciecola sp. LCG003]WJG08885.1 Bor family protein [Aliiglaciecola sp. LCG003]
MGKSIIMLGGVVLLAGCATQSFKINDGIADRPDYHKMQHFFFSGVAQEQQIDAAKICFGAENIIKVEVRQSFLNGVLGYLSYGIYTPRDIKIFCKSSTSKADSKP